MIGLYDEDMPDRTPNVDQLPAVPPTPPYLRGTDKRSLVLRAAHTHFLRDGFSNTSMDAVALTAGVSKKTVYAHFENKDTLFETLIKLGSEHVFASLPPLERREGDPRLELQQFFVPFLTLILKMGGHAWSRMIIAENHRFPEYGRIFYQCTVERIRELVKNYFQQLAGETHQKLADVGPLADAFIAMTILGPLHRVLMIGNANENVAENLTTAIDIVFSQLKIT
jgi:AcrR family transcriptional regulator